MDNSICAAFQNFFPEPIRVVFLLKPEGVLQRALEVGYRNFTENDKFKVSHLPEVDELLQAASRFDTGINYFDPWLGLRLLYQGKPSPKPSVKYSGAHRLSVHRLRNRLSPQEKNLALIHRDDPGPGNGYLIWGRQARMDPSLKSGL